MEGVRVGQARGNVGRFQKRDIEDWVDLHETGMSQTARVSGDAFGGFEGSETIVIKFLRGVGSFDVLQRWLDKVVYLEVRDWGVGCVHIPLESLLGEMHLNLKRFVEVVQVFDKSLSGGGIGNHCVYRTLECHLVVLTVVGKNRDINMISKTWLFDENSVIENSVIEWMID